MIVLQVLGGIAGAALLLAILAALVWRWARRRLQAAHYCEFCWSKPADFITNFDDGPPLGICEPCRKEKMGSLMTEAWLQSGKLRPIPGRTTNG